MSSELPPSAAGLPQSEGKGTTRRTVRKSTLNAVVQGTHAALNILTFIILARCLGKDILGEYATLYALILILQLTLEAGIGTLLTCRIARNPAKWQATAGEAAGLCVLISLASLLVFLGLGAVWAWHRHDVGVFPWFVSAGVACAGIQVQRFCVGLYRAFEEFGHENLGKLMQGGSFAALAAALAMSGSATLGGAVAIFAASQVIADTYLVWTLRSRCRGLTWRCNLSVLKDWLREAAPVGLGDIVRGPVTQIDVLLLGWLQPPAAVGLYSVAYRPLGPLQWLAYSILTTTFPSVVRLAAGDRAQLDRTFYNNIRLLGIFSLPLAIGITFGAAPLITLLFGQEYVEAALPLAILIWKMPLMFVSMQFRFLFTAIGKQKVFGRLVLLASGLEIAAELALIPAFGYLGACSGCLLGELAFTSVGLYLYRRWGTGDVEWGKLLRAALAGAVMVGGLTFAAGLSWPLLVAARAGATGVYFGLCVLFGALGRKELWHFYEIAIGAIRRTRRAPARELVAAEVP